MAEKAILALEDGTIFEGYAMGAGKTSWGEVVFNTSMTGYQEMLTDPSYSGQLLAFTYPLIGNYGINAVDTESRQVQVSGAIAKEICARPSHWQNKLTLQEYLESQAVSGIYGIDTRKLTRHIRSYGVLMGIITSEMTGEEALETLRGLPAYDTLDFTGKVTTDALYRWNGDSENAGSLYNVVLFDMGVKYNIARILTSLGCRVTVVPCSYTSKQILDLNPDGVLLSPGPGDPSLLDEIAQTVAGLVTEVPVMGICLGHQMIARAFGATTFKLKFGHRGANHPVRELATGRVMITAQNHGYAVDAETVGNGLAISHINLNDGTVEGLRHSKIPVFSIQYHSEGSPGPQDNIYLFEQFIKAVKERKTQRTQEVS